MLHSEGKIFWPDIFLTFFTEHAMCLAAMVWWRHRVSARQ